MTKKTKTPIAVEDTRKTYFNITTRVYPNGNKEAFLLGGYLTDKKPENKVFEHKNYISHEDWFYFDTVEEARAYKDELRAKYAAESK